ncbi:MAG: putative DNA binding domain-containing protein [Thermoplasmata archaeon]|nr:putative DNA binding domain-containing protein [Candidatus Sysuiplasma jiujiangense]
MTTLACDVSIKADENYVRGLIQNGESSTAEFKESIDGADGWIKTVCAFSNRDGGLIIFGVKHYCSIAGPN